MDLWPSPTKSGRRHRKDVERLHVCPSPCGLLWLVTFSAKHWGTSLTRYCGDLAYRIIHWKTKISWFVVAGHSMPFFWWSHVAFEKVLLCEYWAQLHKVLMLSCHPGTFDLVSCPVSAGASDPEDG